MTTATPPKGYRSAPPVTVALPLLPLLAACAPPLPPLCHPLCVVMEVRVMKEERVKNKEGDRYREVRRKE